MGSKIWMTAVPILDVPRVTAVLSRAAYQDKGHCAVPQPATTATTPWDGSEFATCPVDDVQQAQRDEGATGWGIDTGVDMNRGFGDISFSHP